MANRQIANLTARTLVMADVIPTQIADASVEAGKNTITELATLLQTNNIVGYKIYSAFVNTSSLVATQAKNTIGNGTGVGAGDIVWTNPSNSIIRGTMTNGTPFPANKTFLTGTSVDNGGVMYIGIGERATDNIIQFKLVRYDNDRSGTPNLSFQVQITVYP